MRIQLVEDDSTMVKSITERKRAEEVLQITQFALDNASDMALETRGRNDGASTITPAEIRV